MRRSARHVAERRVLILNHFAVPSGAPGGTRHVELAGLLRGWDATVIASNRNLLTRATTAAKAEHFRSVWVTPYSGRSLTRVVNWMSFGASAFFAGLRVPADVVYASSPHLFAAAAGWALARVKRCPLVVEVRDLWPQVLVDMGQLRPTSLTFRALKALERGVYRRADAVVVLAEGSRASVVGDGARPESVWFIPNGADVTRFAVAHDRAELRRRYGMQGLIFIYTGAHGPANGLHYVLDAAETVRDTLPDVFFWLVGDGIAKAQLQADAARRSLSNVVFHAAVPKDEVPPLLAAADIGLHVLADVPLFRYGVSPNKLFDYMAAGKPVLTNTPGEVASLVNEANAGVAVGPDGLVEGVRRMAAMTSEALARLGGNGRSFVSEHRSRAKMAARLEELLETVDRR